MQTITNVLELLGTFFLAVEAIKLKNLEKFRFNLKSINSILNPKIILVDEDGEAIPNQAKTNNKKELININLKINKQLTSRKTYSFELFITVLIISSGIIYFGILYICMVDILTFIPIENSYWFYIPKILLGIFIGPVLWTIMICFFNLIIYLFKRIENNTETGIIGIIGFFIFVITFLIKTFATRL